MWLNGEFRTKPWTQTSLSKTPESPPDKIEDEVSDLKPDLSDSEQRGHSPVATWPLRLTICEMSQMAT